MVDIQNLIYQNIVFTKDQQPYLKKHKESNGLNSFFEETTNTARYRAISKLVGHQVLYAKTFVWRAILQSISDKNCSSLTTLTALLTRKCLGTSENTLPNHTIWCAIIHAFVRTHPILQLPTKDDGDDEDEQETSTVPAKQSRNGNRKKVAGDTEFLEDFWVEVGVLSKEKNKSWGSDLKAPGWALVVSGCKHILPIRSVFIRFAGSSCSIAITISPRSVFFLGVFSMGLTMPTQA
ncbi:hypothetical protein B0H10DRAFT_2209502 [Mycena sp. CBHHK59/15]|nr:hypothetical protein B0H10DRAFT_2209502 [Mycena sp. CBHHK59/15]